MGGTMPSGRLQPIASGTAGDCVSWYRYPVAREQSSTKRGPERAEPGSRKILKRAAGSSFLCRPGKCCACYPAAVAPRADSWRRIDCDCSRAGRWPFIPIGRGHGTSVTGVSKADPSVHQRRHLESCPFGTRPLLLVVRHQTAGYLLRTGPMPAAGNDQSCGPSSVPRFQVEDSASAAESPMSWTVGGARLMRAVVEDDLDEATGQNPGSQVAARPLVLPRKKGASTSPYRD